MAKATRIAKNQKEGSVKLTPKDFTVNPETGQVHVSQDKLANLVQANLNKVKGISGTDAVAIKVTVDF